MYQSEPVYPWLALRSDVAVDDSALTTFDYDSWPSSNVFDVQANFPDAKELSVAFYGTDAANEAVTSYKLYGRRHMNGPIILLAQGVATLGAKAVTKNPITKATAASTYWVDTITITAGLLSTSSDPDVFIHDTGADGIAVLTFKRKGFVDLFMEFNIDTCASISAIITGN